jgi:hypothetical protein
MKLSAKALINYQNVNSYEQANQWVVRAGDTSTILYFQLVDLDQSSLRYMAGVGSSNQPAQVQVTFPSIDDTKRFTLIAQQNPNDDSIWNVTIPQTNTPCSGNVQFQLFQGNSINNFMVIQMMVVEYLNDGNDGILPDNTIFF